MPVAGTDVLHADCTDDSSSLMTPIANTTKRRSSSKRIASANSVNTANGGPTIFPTAWHTWRVWRGDVDD